MCSHGSCIPFPQIQLRLFKKKKIVFVTPSETQSRSVVLRHPPHCRDSKPALRVNVDADVLHITLRLKFI